MAFLLGLQPLTGGYHGDKLRYWGISSNAMVTFAMGGLFPDERTMPFDRWDLAACYRAIRRLPRHRRAAARIVLRVYRERMAERGYNWRLV
jgi:hypothetical protein